MWNLLQDELGGGVWPRLLVALVDTGAKGLVLMAAAGLAAAAMRRNAAAARHLVWMLALCGLLLLPVVSVMMPKWTLPILPALETPAPPAIVAPLPPIPAPQPAPSNYVPAPVDALAPTPLNAPPMPAPQPARTTPPNATPPKPAPNPLNGPASVLALWLAVAILSIAPFIAGIIAVARLRRRANTFADSDLQPLAACLAQTLALKRPARLLRAPTGSMPMATGFLRPAVFLPEDALAWTEEKRRVVLLHELAHVKRRDCLTHAIARTATALHWFNPLAWLALRQLRIEREHACDDLVLAAGERPSAYAENLLEIARTLRADTITAAAAITMAQKSQLEGRLLAVLDGARNRGRVTKRLLAASILGTILVLAVISAVDVARSESDARKFELKYASGFTATLIGVTDGAEEKPEVAWRPDGSVLPTVPEFTAPLWSLHPEDGTTIVRRFCLKIQASAGELLDANFGIKFRDDPKDGAEPMGNGGPNTGPILLVTMDANKRKHGFELGVAAGPWLRAADVDFGDSGGYSFRGTQFNSTVNKPFTRDGRTRFVLTHSLKEAQVRVMVTDTNGKEHEAEPGAGTLFDDFLQTEYTLDTLAPEDLKGLELQARDYEWQKFEGIAVNPDNPESPENSTNFTPQKPDEVASSEQPKGDFSVEFPDGCRAHVISVRDPISEASDTFWAADGSPIALAWPAADSGNFTVSPEAIGRLFFVELLPPPDSPAMTDVTFICNIENPGSGSGVSNSGSGDALRSEFFSTFPMNTKEASVKVGVAAGPWKTVFSGCIGCDTGVSDSEFSATFSDVFDQDGAKRITATHKQLQQERRVVAIDAAGDAHPLQHTKSVDGEEISQSEWIFNTIAPEDVKGLEIQIRDYEWRTISGIALYPAEKTAQSNAEQSSAYASDSPYSVFNHDYFGSVLDDPNLLAHIAGDAITPPAADTSWGPVVNSLQAAVRFKPEKPEYLLGEKIDMEFLVRNTGPEPLEFLTSETRLFQLYLSQKISTSISVNSDMGTIRRVKLAPGEVASIDGMCNSVMQNSTRQETEESIGTYEQSHPNIYEIRFDLNFPDAYSNSGEFAPRPGDWTGTLTTGMRNLNLVKKSAPDAATDTRVTKNIFTDSRDEIESNKPQPVVPAFQDPFALNPRDRFLRTPGADAVWGEVNNGLQSALQFTPEKANCVLGEAIPFEFLVRNVGNAPVRFVIREYLQYGEPKVLDGSGKNMLAGDISNTAWPSLVRIQLDPGQCVGLPGEGLAFLPKNQNAASRLNYYVGTYFESEAGMYNIQYSFNLPGGSSTTGEFVPQPGDWTGTLTTGKRTISIMEGPNPLHMSPSIQVRWVASEPGAAKATAAPWRSGSKPTNEPDELWLLDEVLFTEKDIIGVQALRDQDRERFLVKIQLNDEATTRCAKLTQENMGRKMAIVGRGQILAAPTVNGTIGDGQLMIAGNFSEAEANSFADAIRADHPGMADSFAVPDNAAPALGPEVEVTVRHSGENCMIDFDTGKLFTPPNFDGTEDAFAWTAKNGIDAGGGSQPEVRGLIGMDLVLNPEENAIWDNAATDGAQKHDAFKYGKPGNPVYLSAKGDLPATWTFKTREGGLGIVQILGFEDEEPRGVKIRYRMLEANSK